MSTLNSMISKHAPLGAYSITEDSNIYRELEAYAEGLDTLVAELETMLRECFFVTAESYGLDRPERLWGACRQDLTVEKRREMLLTRSAFGYEDFTPKGIGKLLTLLGISGTVTEYPSVQRIVLDMSAETLTEGQQNWIISQLDALLPAHLEADIVVSGFCWDDGDTLGLTFDEMDGSQLSWDQIDVYKG